MVELSVMKIGGDDRYENYVTFDADDLAHRALRVEEDGGRGYSVGYTVPPEARTQADLCIVSETQFLY